MQSEPNVEIMTESDEDFSDDSGSSEGSDKLTR